MKSEAKFCIGQTVVIDGGLLDGMHGIVAERKYRERTREVIYRVEIQLPGEPEPRTTLKQESSLKAGVLH